MPVNLFYLHSILQYKVNYASYSDLITVKETLINAKEKPLYRLWNKCQVRNWYLDDSMDV